MTNLFKLGVKSIEFINEEFEFYLEPTNFRRDVGLFTAQLATIQLKVQQGLLKLSIVSKTEAAILDGETGKVLCILRK